jgi:DNA sulfur modification protein DndD
MIFEKIAIYNLFTYYGKRTLDLSGQSSDRNIVLISGRNGYGKTNFLNSIKLLFGGITDDLKSSVQRGRKPKNKHYVMGTGSDWLGIMNIKARSEGEDTCGVEATWCEEAGRVRLSRNWILRSHQYDMQLFLEADFLDEPLTQDDEDEIRRFLDERIPQSYIPFFFFDGEQIQEMAEANWNAQQQHMERLLNISPVETLIDFISVVIRDWKREALDQKEKVVLIGLENDLKKLEAEAQAKQQAIDDFSSETETLEDRTHYLDRLIEGMRAFRNQADEVRLKQENKNLEEQRLKLQGKISEVFPRDIPLYANLHLVRSSIDELRKLIESESGVQSELLKELAKNLPQQVLEMPPFPTERLSPKQIDFYKERIKNIIIGYMTKPEHWAESTFQLDAFQAKQILDILVRYTNQEILISERAEEFRELRSLKAKIRDIREQLENISTLSADEQTLYQQRVDEKVSLEHELTDKKAEMKRIKSELKAIHTNIERKEKEIEIQQERYERSQKARKKVDKADAFRGFFNEYKSELKKLRREEIENAINIHFPKLMTSHGMINRIDIGDDFDIHYKDSEGRPIGMGNLSAGMKQLVSTSLLWALKDVSNKKIPLIVDTPLARIDRIHQENLLSRYYPEASHQVILLPTDSELDKNKYSILKPYVYREYVLKNPTGFETQIVEEEMYSQDEISRYA